VRHTNILAVFALALTIVLAACAGPKQPARDSSAMASASMLPQEVQAAPERVRSAYQFALTNPDALKNVPCYCGCGAMGHTSNLSCYIKERKADGQIVFDDHALGCSLCVDISQDVMRLTGEGKSPQAIRTDIVAAYSKFGPANQ
jgi:hypothetical protein